jgi:hypothetical protein
MPIFTRVNIKFFDPSDIDSVITEKKRPSNLNMTFINCIGAYITTENVAVY